MSPRSGRRPPARRDTSEGWWRAREPTPRSSSVRLTFGGAGRGSSLVRDAWWYPFALATSGARLDLLHCTTFRAPARRARRQWSPCTTSLLRHPKTFPLASPLGGVASCRRAARRRDRRRFPAFTRCSLVELLGVAHRTDPRGAKRHSTRSSSHATGGRGRLCARRRYARTTQESRRGGRGGQDRGRRACVVGAPGWGGVEVPGWSDAPRTTSWRRCTGGLVVFLYPSLYEGFGLPVLEAMAWRTPVVTSRGGATEEMRRRRGFLVTQPTPRRSPRASTRRSGAGPSSFRAGSSVRVVHVAACGGPRRVALAGAT